MEKALYITNLERLKHWNKNYSRIYFGAEFCEKLIPKKEELEKVLFFVKEKELEFTFIAPYLTEKGLKEIAPLLEFLSKKKPNSEVVFGDWGIVRKIKELNLIPAMGRILNRQYRDSRIKNITGKAPEKMILHYRKCAVDSKSMRAFLLSEKIERVELDNLLQGIETDLSESGISGSVYFPYIFVTTTRLCLSNCCDRLDLAGRVGIFQCGKECQRYSFELENKNLRAKLYLKGNTIFLKNDEIQQDIKKRGINRIVYLPEIPI